MLHVRELDHLVLNVADVERALRFYVDGLGLTPERVDAYRRGEVGFPSVRVTGETIIDLFPPAMHGGPSTGPSNVNHLCFAVAAAIDEMRGVLDAMGVPVEQSATHNFGARGFADSLYVRDPDGNLVELRTYGDATP